MTLAVPLGPVLAEVHESRKADAELIQNGRV
jgi:hypothetical protein